jgi:hypothetical protein
MPALPERPERKPLTKDVKFESEFKAEIQAFCDMLEENKIVVVGTTWEKELPKILHDERTRKVP